MTQEPEDNKPQPFKSIAMALAKAQAKMGKALKTESNEAFKRGGKVSKYADLASVIDACVPALNECGIAVIQPTTDDENGRYVETVLIHGDSGETLKCRVPLIVQKNDMQGYGSAVTYARRYGLMSMAGIAPEDDDGNAAASAAPTKPEPPRTITPDQFVKIRKMIEDAELDEAVILKHYGAESLEQFPAAMFDKAMHKMQATIDAKTPKKDDLGGDEIPF